MGLAQLVVNFFGLGKDVFQFAAAILARTGAQLSSVSILTVFTVDDLTEEQMKRVMTAIAVLCVLTASVASAAPGRGRGSDGPPGLAGKPYGMPPGQVKKMWRKGERIPSTYIVPQFFIAEPRVYHLAPPPPGHRWVVVDGDAYLVQTTSGMIAEVIAGAVAGLIR